MMLRGHHGSSSIACRASEVKLLDGISDLHGRAAIESDLAAHSHFYERCREGDFLNGSLLTWGLRGLESAQLSDGRKTVF
ncbi:hypothetical protein [Novosphingobium sp. JCM 18896]|uniref:hypothetical protein n=1 Tax=Novosphingobium sp. JCM 18896 TaxID=2989731 RepID=UPI00222281E0|nr:hypothetical protein [Novosphingobium sp. JCM 18896]MCW1432468.1 hypothetical protein [Novosphingobium sp. JCM 18896]